MSHDNFLMAVWLVVTVGRVNEVDVRRDGFAGIKSHHSGQLSLAIPPCVCTATATGRNGEFFVLNSNQDCWVYRPGPPGIPIGEILRIPGKMAFVKFPREFPVCFLKFKFRLLTY